MSSRLLVAATALALCVGAADPAAAESMPAVQIRVLDQGDAPVRVTAAEWAGANALRIRVGSDLSRGVSSTWVIVFVVRPDGYFAGSQVQLLNPLRGLLNPAGVAEGLVSLSEFQLREGSAVLVAIDRAATARGTWTRAGTALGALMSATPVGLGLPAFPLELRGDDGSSPAQAGCGQDSCSAGRTACKGLCRGAKGVLSFTCGQRDCYWQCVCAW